MNELTAFSKSQVIVTPTTSGNLRVVVTVRLNPTSRGTPATVQATTTVGA